MDTITHGIAGSLIGKAYFSKRGERIAIFAATVGAMFPDIDTVAEAFSSDPLAIVKIHRGITHSFIALPFFALVLAWLTRWFARRRGIESPSFAMLVVIYAVAIASHIILDGMTSFGTRMWTPVSHRRVAWDMLFIIDFTFSLLILIPQILAWVYRSPRTSRPRAVFMWLLLSVCAAIVWETARLTGYPFHIWIVFFIVGLFAVLFFVPSAGGSGFRITRSAWCQAGVYVTAVYLVACGAAHAVALHRAEAFASAKHLTVERIGALPIPPSFLDWGDAIRTPAGVYQSQFDLRSSAPVEFQFVPDSPANPYTLRALELPEVKTYWNFVRFPSIHYSSDGDYHIVDFGEHRFTNGGRRAPQPFSYRVVFDSDENIIGEGFWPNGMFLSRLTRMHALPLPRSAPSP